MSRNLFSYVVRYDSGFAPNPFHGYCTLATCKPGIRAHAKLDDWLVGTGSRGAAVRREGHLVYAMRITEALSNETYWRNQRFGNKKPDMYHNWVAAAGDNIYEPIGPSEWRQLNSYHSKEYGRPNEHHIRRDTAVERVLVSEDYVYFGGEGPKLPPRFLSRGGMDLLCAGRNHRRIRDDEVIHSFEAWIRSLGAKGYQGKPWDWLRRRR